MLDRKKLQEIFGKISHYAGRVLEANITEQDETDLKNLIQKIESTDELSFVIKETNNLPQEIKTEIYAAYKNIFTAQAAKIIMDSDAKNIEELLSIKQKFNDLPKSAGNILEMQPLYEALANKAINILTASKDIDTLLRIRTKEFNKLPDKVLEVLSKKPIADIFAKRAGEIMRSIVQQTATLEALQSVINQYNKLPADAHQKLLLSSLLSNKAMQMIKTADNPQQVLSIYNIMKGEQIFNVDSAKKAADNRLKELELQHKVISQAVRSGLQQKTNSKRGIDAPRTANSVVSRIQGQVKGLVKKLDVSKQSKGLVKHLKRNVRDMEQLIRGVSSNGNPFSEKQKEELYTKIKESLVGNLAMYNNLAKSDGFTSNMEKTILPIIDRCKTLSNELEADLHHKQMAIAVLMKDIPNDVAELTRLVHKFSSDPTEKRKNKIMEGISILNQEFKEAERTIHDSSIVSEIKALKTAFETETEKFNEYLEQNEDWETVDDLKRSLKSSTPIRSPATLPDNKHDVSKKTEINDPAQSEFKSPVFFESHATRAEPSHTIKPHNDSKITAVVRALGRVLPARIKDRYVQPEEQAKLLMQNINKDMKGLEKLIDKASSDKKSLEKYGEKILKMISDLRHSFDNYDDLAKNANIPSADKFKEQFKQSTETFYQSINKFADTIGHQKSSKGMPFLDRLADQIFVKSVLDQSGTLFKPNRCRKLFAFGKGKALLKESRLQYESLASSSKQPDYAVAGKITSNGTTVMQINKGDLSFPKIDDTDKLSTDQAKLFELMLKNVSKGATRSSGIPSIAIAGHANEDLLMKILDGSKKLIKVKINYDAVQPPLSRKCQDVIDAHNNKVLGISIEPKKDVTEQSSSSMVFRDRSNTDRGRSQSLPLPRGPNDKDQSRKGGRRNSV